MELFEMKGCWWVFRIVCVAWLEVGWLDEGQKAGWVLFVVVSVVYKVWECSWRESDSHKILAAYDNDLVKNEDLTKCMTMPE